MRSAWRYALPFLVFLALAVFLRQGLFHNLSSGALTSPLIGKPVPAVVMRPVFLGQVTVLNIFATWCTYCRLEHPIWMDVANTESGVRFIGIDYKDNPQALSAWLKQYGNPYDQVLADPSGDLGIALGVYGTPETFIIDQKGIIRAKYVGPVTQSVWKTVLAPKIQALEAHD